MNHITVKGNLAQGAALKVTCVWDDPAGKDRRHVTVVGQTPYTYGIVAGGGKWEDCVCRPITIEAVPATGAGNRTEVKEQPAPRETLPPIRRMSRCASSGRRRRPDRLRSQAAATAWTTAGCSSLR
jgi:hypothetical protein